MSEWTPEHFKVPLTASELLRQRDALAAALREFVDNYQDGYIAGHAPIIKKARKLLASIDSEDG